MWDLQQDSGTVTRIGFTTLRATMLKVRENLKGFPDDIVGSPTGNVDNKADTATVVLKFRVVQSLLRWQR
jgi:hypothetical protein